MLILRNTASSHPKLIPQVVILAIPKRSYLRLNLPLVMPLHCLPGISLGWLARWTTLRYRLCSLVLDQGPAKEHLYPLNHNNNQGNHRLTSTPFSAA
jgi:hypothetical protein